MDLPSARKRLQRIALALWDADGAASAEAARPASPPAVATVAALDAMITGLDAAAEDMRRLRQALAKERQRRERAAGLPPRKQGRRPTEDLRETLPYGSARPYGPVPERDGDPAEGKGMDSDYGGLGGS